MKEWALASYLELRGPKAAMTDCDLDVRISLSLTDSLAARGRRYVIVVMPFFWLPDTVEEKEERKLIFVFSHTTYFLMCKSVIL